MRRVFLLLLVVSAIVLAGCMDGGESAYKESPELDIRRTSGDPPFEAEFEVECEKHALLERCVLDYGDGEQIDLVPGEKHTVTHVYPEGYYTIWARAYYSDGRETKSVDAIYSGDPFGFPGGFEVFLTTNKGSDKVLLSHVSFIAFCNYKGVKVNLESCVLDFGDGSSPEAIDPRHWGQAIEGPIIYHGYEPGEYNATLTATHSSGKTRVSSVVVVAREGVSWTDLGQAYYRWSYKGYHFNWNPMYNHSDYKYFKTQPRVKTIPTEYGYYVYDERDDEIIQNFTNAILDYQDEYNFTKAETRDFVTAFVQNLKYSFDNATTPYDDYPRFPLETLYLEQGDCEDTAILLAALLSEMGYKVVLVHVPRHMAIGVECHPSDGYHYIDDEGDAYCYVETTNPGWIFGQVPSEYVGVDPIRLFHLDPSPLLQLPSPWWYKWPPKAEGGHWVYEYNIQIENLGSATAEDIELWMALDSRTEGKVWDQTTISVEDIAAGERVTVQGDLKKPKSVETRLLLSVSYGDGKRTYKSQDWPE
ncbi:hypothetical protein ACFLQ2_02940 [archaeon]